MILTSTASGRNISSWDAKLYKGIQSTRTDCLTSLQFQRRMPVNAI